MKIIVCGGRNFFSYPVVQLVLDRFNITELAHGGAVGTDSLAGAYAKANDIPYKVYKADWDKHGKAAGMIRNKEMLKDFDPYLVIAFPGGKGTENMIQISQDDCRLTLIYDEQGKLGSI